MGSESQKKLLEVLSLNSRSFSVPVCVCICVLVHACVSVCVCVWSSAVCLSEGVGCGMVCMMNLVSVTLGAPKFSQHVRQCILKIIYRFYLRDRGNCHLLVYYQGT